MQVLAKVIFVFPAPWKFQRLLKLLLFRLLYHANQTIVEGALHFLYNNRQLNHGVRKLYSSLVQ